MSSVDSPLTPSASAALCNAFLATPVSECVALAELFRSTNGIGWHNKSNWMAITPGISPCNWYGVICNAGHVTELRLGHNRLFGGLPPNLADLTQLTTLQLNDNGLSELPQSVCLLTDTVTNADVSYNRLIARNRDIANCLSQLDPDWETTQTVFPRQLKIITIVTDALHLTWAPVPNPVVGGYYEIRFAIGFTNVFTLAGKTTDLLANSFVLQNLRPGVAYAIQVRTVTPSHAEQSNLLISEPASLMAVTQSANRVMLAAYFAADNDLSAYADSMIERFRTGTFANPNITVVFFVDRAGDHNSELWQITGGITTPTSIISDEWGTDELDSSDPAVLTWFLDYARNSVAADRNLAILIGHGVGLTPELSEQPVSAQDAQRSLPQSEIPALPRNVDYTPTDITNNSYFSTPDLGQALLAATDNGANPYDLIFFDQCFQGNLDVLYEFHQAAKVFVASPNYAWLVAPYGLYLPHFTPTASPEEMANAIIHIYQSRLTNENPNAIFWLRGSDIPVIAKAVDTLAGALTKALNAGAEVGITNAATHAQYVDTTQCGRAQMKLGPPDELMGAGSFARNLQRTFAVGDPHGVNLASAQLLTTLAQVKGISRVGRPYIAPEEFWVYTDTLTILAPLKRNAPGNVAWRASIYTNTAPVIAAWSPAPTMTVMVSSTFAYVRDGAWDDFIDLWYITPMTPTVGEWCHYIPPAVAISSTAEIAVISLTVQSGQLAWSGVQPSDIAVYQILVDSDDQVGWRVEQVLTGSQTSFTPEELRPGRYQVRVVGVDVDGAVVAQSNEIQVEIREPAPTPSEMRVYLPVVVRE